MPVLIALGRLRQEDCSEFGDLGCRVRPHFKKTNLKVSLLQELIRGPSVTLVLMVAPAWKSDLIICIYCVPVGAGWDLPTTSTLVVTSP